jgi:iron complex outermembrane receptor protein
LSRAMKARLLVRHIAVALATFLVALAAPAQEESSSNEATGDETAQESSEATPLWEPEPAASDTSEQSSETTSAEVPGSDQAAAEQSSDTATPNAPAPDASAAAQDATTELKTIPVEDSGAVAAQSPSSSPRLDDVVVTAQKRQQGVMDVPISMSVLSDTFIRNQGITDIAEALRYVPNFKVVELFNKTTPQCRGFTVDDVNPAFESPCGVALDGISYGRSSYFSSGLFDIERLEVLRGPQGTTFGKNTTAGVVSLYTKEPTDTFTGKADVQYGLEGAARKRAEAAFGGPLIRDVVNFRVAAVTEERDGFMENTYHLTDPSVPPTTGGRENTSWRVRLNFPDVFGSQIKLLHEQTDSTSLGMVGKIYTTDDSANADYIRQYDPNADFGETYKTSIIGPQNVPQQQVRTHAEWSRPFADWDVALLGAFGEISTSYTIYPAMYPVRWIRADRSESDPFVTGELRTISPDFDGLFGLNDLFGWNLGSSRLLAGIFAQKTQIKDLHLRVTYDDATTGGILASNVGVFIPDATYNEFQDASGVDQEEWADLNFDQTAQTAALFAQFTWDVTEDWTLDLGGRLSRETKVGDWNTFYSQPAPILDTTGDGGFVDHEEIKETTFQPKISVGYKVTDRINLFAHWARANKSGGFNFYTITGDPEDADPPGRHDYGPETATDHGLDLKTILWDGMMRLNLSVFQLNLDDFQVLTEVKGTTVIPAGPQGGSINVPDNYQEVRNAAKARAQGIELDVHFVPFDWLTAIGSFALNDTNYISFPIAGCGGGETPSNETGRCDHSGKSFSGVPRRSASLGLDGKFPLGGYWSVLGDLEFLIGGGGEYIGDTNFDSAEHSSGRREPLTIYRGHVGVASLGQGWSFRVIGLNLADEYLYAARTRSIEAASGEPFGLGVPMPPRTVFGQLNYTFY